VAGRVLAMGGLREGRTQLLELLLELTGQPRPRLVFLPTPAADDADWIDSVRGFAGTTACELDVVTLFGMPERAAERVAAADAVLVSGGNTANALAVWRVHGVDRALREAWSRGAVLGGASAGANCWFEASVTDSFGPQLAPLHDGLGLLPGSFCPHYDGEELRRPVYGELVRGGFPAGYAADDDCALRFDGQELREVVAQRPGARAYRVSAAVEEPLEARLL
jgi:dipeptidase E